MKQLTAIAIILLFTACARKAHTEKSISTASKDSTYRFVDSTKTIVATKITEVTNYGGDSLQGNLFFSEPFADSLLYNQSDSLESNGIKVKVTIQPQKGGGF